MNVATNRLDASYQRSVDAFVGNLVILNVSQLISELAQQPEYSDELIEVLIRDDYVTPVRDAIQECEDTLLLDEMCNSTAAHLDLDSMRRAALAFIAGEDEWEAAANELNVEPETEEALEHWVVDRTLAERLEERGEMVLYDFMGLPAIWGRTTSGQAIALDGVICDIHDEARA